MKLDPVVLAGRLVIAGIVIAIVAILIPVIQKDVAMANYQCPTGTHVMWIDSLRVPACGDSVQGTFRSRK